MIPARTVAGLHSARKVEWQSAQALAALRYSGLIFVLSPARKARAVAVALDWKSVENFCHADNWVFSLNIHQKY